MLKILKPALTLLCLAVISGLAAQTKELSLPFGKTTVLSSKILNEDRRINILLPDDFNAQDSVQYPIIYILDGGMAEDFFHLSGIIRFQTQPWIAQFPNAVVVGIENTDRRRDFTFAVPNIDFIEKEGFRKSSFPRYGGSAQYMAFLENELLPYINKTYKGNGKNTVIGESLAGLLSTEILLTKPYMFSDYLIISPSLWWGEGALLEKASALLDKNLKSKVRVYVGAPSKDEDIKMYQEAEALFKILSAKNEVYCVFDYLPNETHATVIHQAVYNAFRLLHAADGQAKQP
ncbi:alpha/beta hydrolase [Sphingobacterium sp. Mn56C]|uniref:alpha/beta hydrolase n=1 Tax=Sphingobacterium sp. Mn56C TaxID=3395261 RepID=UPI003BCEA6EB